MRQLGAERELWLDGLRGLSALLVTFQHFTIGEWTTPDRSYWAEPADSNRRIVQMPPLRLLFAARGGIAMFMVVSSYSTSLGLVSAREQDSRLDFYKKLSSAVLRRGVRLFMPVVIISLIYHVLFFLGFFEWWLTSPECPDLQPLGRPLSHLRCWVQYVFDMMNILGPTPGGLSGVLWTIPLEFRGSLLIYLITLGLAEVRQKYRVLIIQALALFLLWSGHAYPVGFCFGLAMVESRTVGLAKARGQIGNGLMGQSEKTQPRWSLPSFVRIHIPILFGTMLLSLPFGDPLPPDYWFQSWINFPHWDSAEIRTQIWCTVGAVLITFGVQNSPATRAMFETKAAQFLGKISFPMYLLHMAVIHVMRNRMLQVSAKLFIGKKYRAAVDGGEDNIAIFAIWLLTGVVYMACIGALSNWTCHWLNYSTVHLAKRAEKNIQ